MSDFATLTDVVTLTGKEYSAEESDRIEALLPLVSDALRMEARAVGKNLDEMVSADSAYASVVKMVTVDVVARVMRQSMDGEPLSQESQSGLGYSWSGTYAVPGGGISGAIMRNDLKRLGLRRQRIGVYEIWDGSQDEA
jgi:hypothetical protein